ncbi:hypothetical protein Smic_32960 [Streptomyces microflavus]|uniref:Uncharacterized protein n=1 Tax=Streptomyces microflavus TaxID=1919 RepID=A0A7J0CQH2_STRMI|nr:hypothetical protein Smic_32960 [Streptomyces microflavus]
MSGSAARDPYELDGGAAPDLLAQRADEPFQRLLGGGLMVVVGRRHRTEDDDPPARGQGAYDGVQGGVDVPEPGGRGDPRGVEDDRGGPVGVADDREPGPGKRLRHPRDRRRPRRQVQQRPLQVRGLQGPAAQWGGLRQAEPAGEEAAGCCAGEVQIAIGHCPGSLLGRRFTPE